MTTAFAGSTMWRYMARMRAACCAGSGRGAANRLANHFTACQRANCILGIRREYRLLLPQPLQGLCGNCVHHIQPADALIAARKHSLVRSCERDSARLEREDV